MSIFKELELARFGHSINLAGGVYIDDQTKKMHVILFPGEAEAGVNVESVLPATADDWNKLFQQTDTLDVEVFAKDPDGKIIKIIVRKSQRNIAQEENWTVMRRDGFACRYCGADDVPMTTDHLVLWEQGGPSIAANMTCACRKCNRTRGNMQYQDWLNSPYYKKVSAKLTPEQRQANLDVVGALASIPITINQRSSRS